MQALSRFFTRLGVGGTLLGLYGVFWFGPAQGADFRYEIRPGDTIISVSQRFLQNPKQYWRVQQHNKISNVFALQPGSTLAIPADLLRREPADAKTIAVSGTATLRDGASSTPLQVGTLVKPGSSVITGSDGSAALELPDLSILRIPPGQRAASRSGRTLGRRQWLYHTGQIDQRTGRKPLSRNWWGAAASMSPPRARQQACAAPSSACPTTAPLRRRAARCSKAVWPSMASHPLRWPPAPPRATQLPPIPRSVVLDAGSGSVVDKSGIPLPPPAPCWEPRRLRWTIRHCRSGRSCVFR